MRTIEHWVGGKSTALASTRTGSVWNPATGEQQAEVLLATKEDVDTAVARAQEAFAEWSQASLRC
jgi:malonate-semialdehyde dehydrogenase (acetylating)/methylmalonate-semialdehyde dehydrogenase